MDEETMDPMERSGATYTLHYPKDEEYDYFVKMERIDLDKECEKDLSNQKTIVSLLSAAGLFKIKILT